MTEPGTGTLNPWLSMWTRPRATMRQILDSKPERMVIPLAMIGGFSQALDRASMRSLGDHMPLPAVLAVCAVGGALFGVLALYVFGALLRWTGRWIGGKGTPEAIRAAIAWPNVLTAWGLLLWVPQIVLIGNEVFTSETPRLAASPPSIMVYMTFAAFKIVVGIWSLVVFLKCLGEAQGFSAWRALGNTALPVVLVAVPILILVILATTLAT